MLLLHRTFPPMTLRQATPDDADRISELLGQLGYPARAAAIRRRLERLAASNADETWLAERDGEIVGLVGLHVSESLEHDGPVGKISEIVVEERLRGKGIGATLMKAAEREGRRRGRRPSSRARCRARSARSACRHPGLHTRPGRPRSAPPRARSRAPPARRRGRS